MLSASSSRFSGLASKYANSSIVTYYRLKTSIYGDYKLYSTSTTSLESLKTTKAWNLHLNKLYKLRYYDQASLDFEQMKKSGIEVDRTTYWIMYQNFSDNFDLNSSNALLTDAKAKGWNPFMLTVEEAFQSNIASRATRGKAMNAYSKFERVKQAMLNPFDTHQL